MKSKSASFTLPHNISPGCTGGGKVVVVGIFGKSPVELRSCKAAPIDVMLGRSVFHKSIFNTPSLDKDTMSCIEGYYDSNQNTIFLHLVGVYDAYCLEQVWADAEEEIEDKGFLPVWAGMKCNWSKAVLFLLSVSHLVIISHPTAVFDVTHIKLFRTLDAVRVKAQQFVCELLRDIPGIGPSWVSHGRLCSPRVLLLFYSRSPHLHTATPEGTMSPVKRLEHALEDQIYRILRKSRIITNVSGNSLFAVPANQEYVFVETNNNSNSNNSVNSMVSQLVNMCNNNPATLTPNNLRPSPVSPSSYSSQLHSLHVPLLPLHSDVTHTKPKLQEHSFSWFLWQHIEIALSKGFDDNVGRQHGPSFFELPTAEVWFEAVNKVYQFFMVDTQDHNEYKAKQAFVLLHNLTDIDMRFSEARCSKVLPLATAAYQENLPSHYTAVFHQNKLDTAIELFLSHARGPATEKYIGILHDECENYWQDSRQMCEVISLTGNHCINPLHTTDNNHKNLPVMSHSSSIKYVSTCNCGRKQSTREDPFDARTANFTFYQELATDCCDLLEAKKFPVFTPSTKDIRSAEEKSSEEKHVRIEEASASTQHLSMGISDLEADHEVLTPPSGTADAHTEEDEEEESHKQSDAEASDEDEEGEDKEEDELAAQVENLNMEEEGEQSAEDVSTRSNPPTISQDIAGSPIAGVSTVEYLSGMLHSESPLDLLPYVPHWSLLCLGPSSLYSHSHGVQDQPSFLSHTNFLLPWDVMVKVDSKDKWPAIAESMGKKGQFLKAKKGKTDLSEFNVKIFIGVEYECPRSHRFMCSSPEKVLKSTGQGIVKEDANKIANANMPLYFPCPCSRAGKQVLAQLMRVHIVTPKAPVHVTLFPKVQPAPSPCPVFHTGVKEPIRLSQSAYWVLRLPFIYMGKHGPYLPPKDANAVGYGKLIKGLYGITEVLLDVC